MRPLIVVIIKMARTQRRNAKFGRLNLRKLFSSITQLINGVVPARFGTGMPRLGQLTRQLIRAKILLMRKKVIRYKDKCELPDNKVEADRVRRRATPYKLVN